MQRKIILSQEQLDEITGLMPYFDGNSELHGPNEVGTGEEMSDGSYGNPLDQTTDGLADTLTPQDAYMGIGRSHGRNSLQIYERNKALEQMPFTVGDGDEKKVMSYTNTTTTLSRMNKLLDRIKKGDQSALQTFNNMGGQATYNELKLKYDAAKNTEKQHKKVKSEILGQNNVYQKPGGTKNTIKTQGGIINYNN